MGAQRIGQRRCRHRFDETFLYDLQHGPSGLRRRNTDSNRNSVAERNADINIDIDTDINEYPGGNGDRDSELRRDDCQLYRPGRIVPGQCTCGC